MQGKQIQKQAGGQQQKARAEESERREDLPTGRQDGSPMISPDQRRSTTNFGDLFSLSDLEGYETDIDALNLSDISDAYFNIGENFGTQQQEPGGQPAGAQPQGGKPTGAQPQKGQPQGAQPQGAQPQ